MTFGVLNESSSGQSISISQFGFKTAELKDLPKTHTVSNYVQGGGSEEVKIWGPLFIHVRTLITGDLQLLRLTEVALPQVEKLPKHHLAGGILFIPANSDFFPVAIPYPNYVYRIVIFDGDWEKVLLHVCPHQELAGQIAGKAVQEMAKVRINFTWREVSTMIPRLIDPGHRRHIDACAICQHVFANAIRFAPES
ncbi:MAG: hypothetical protein KBC15_04090 [Candidatus Levybacteria bacterium]|nr:hypothetical protein [Candidatus Levybacteria bacterium]